ncbi:MAG: hypothetical protein C0497_13640 [Gemmatimonas sp.]|nr:hypothetical protein [Gemmatimonas sp.]
MKPLSDYHTGAASFADMATASTEYGALFQAQRERALVPADLLARTEALGDAWHLLVISEDWCIDSQSAVPVVSALADAAANLSLRIVSRDAHPELMDTHLTNGTSRSIPVVIVLDANFEERGWWGPRPRALQERMATEWKQLDKPERSREIRRWYAVDKGRTILEEVVALLERAAVAQPAIATAGR